MEKHSDEHCEVLRWMCGYTRSDEIRNKDSRGRVELASMADKMREVRLRWFRHAKRRCADAPVRWCKRFDIFFFGGGGARRGGRPKKY